MKRLLLVRHGETIWNMEQRLQGQIDIPLNDTGREQARKLAERLAGERLDWICSSDLQRAMETAAIIAAPHALEVRAEPRLRQFHLGVFQGKTPDEIEAYFGGKPTAEQWENPPGGESVEAYHARLRAWLDDIRRDDRGEIALAVAHGHVLRMVIALALEIDLTKAWRFTISNASLSELHFRDDGAVLYRLNDAGHLNHVVHHEADQ